MEQQQTTLTGEIGMEHNTPLPTVIAPPSTVMASGTTIHVTMSLTLSANIESITLPEVSRLANDDDKSRDNPVPNGPAGR